MNKTLKILMIVMLLMVISVNAEIKQLNTKINFTIWNSSCISGYLKIQGNSLNYESNLDNKQTDLQLTWYENVTSDFDIYLSNINNKMGNMSNSMSSVLDQVSYYDKYTKCYSELNDCNKYKTDNSNYQTTYNQCKTDLDSCNSVKNSEVLQSQQCKSDKETLTKENTALKNHRGGLIFLAIILVIIIIILFFRYVKPTQRTSEPPTSQNSVREFDFK